MLVLAGIDEAGYGPRLGPLCVGCAAFVLERCDPADGAPPLWQHLRGAVCRKAGDRRRRIAVDDSKKLKGPKDGPSHPLRHFERGVMSFCPSEPPATDTELFTVLDTVVPERPWFASTSDLPLAHTADELRIARGHLRRTMRRAAITCEAMWCEAVDPEALNRQIEAGRSKADVNFRAAMALVDRIWRRFPGEHPRILIDRHGGRLRYGALLEEMLGASADTVAETPSLSRYRLKRGTGELTVSFALGGDERFLPISLASMVAKYVRELLMLRLNRFFQDHLPELRPTAGYCGDASRYLTEIKPVMQRLALPASQLIRAV